ACGTQYFETRVRKWRYIPSALATIVAMDALDPKQCYAAIQSHDPRFDGLFFVAVASTDIYCRPICRVRMPRFEHCSFYANAASAEQAGYRPCLRCRPELAPGNSRADAVKRIRSEEHTSELQSRENLVCRLLLEKKKNQK